MQVPPSIAKVVACRRILSALAVRPLKRSELASTVCTSLAAIDRWLPLLREAKLACIVAWHRADGKRSQPVFGLGFADVLLKPKTNAQKCKAWRKRGNDSHRARALKKKTVDPLLAALMGTKNEHQENQVE